MAVTLVECLKAQLDLSLTMLESEIETCPDGLWDKKAGGYVFWQQVLHCLAGLTFWLRSENGEYAEPFHEREPFAELERDPAGTVNKAEMRGLARDTRALIERFFEGKNDGWLLVPNVIRGELTNADVVLGQVRHVMYHAGHCDSALRDRGHEAVEWVESRG